MNAMKTTFLMALLMVLAVGIGYLLGGNGGMVIAFVFAAGMNLFSYWFSDKLVLKMYRARQITEADSPRLFAVVRDLSMKAGMPAKSM